MKVLVFVQTRELAATDTHGKRVSATLLSAPRMTDSIESETPWDYGDSRFGNHLCSAGMLVGAYNFGGNPEPVGAGEVADESGFYFVFEAV